MKSVRGSLLAFTLPIFVFLLACESGHTSPTAPDASSPGPRTPQVFYQITGSCGKPPLVITFQTHQAGEVIIQGTATGYGLNTDYIMIRLALMDGQGQTHLADLSVAWLFPGEFLSLKANVPKAGTYQASISLDFCFPAQLRVTAPK
jgi:hypothetical protein